MAGETQVPVLTIVSLLQPTNTVCHTEVSEYLQTVGVLTGTSISTGPPDSTGFCARGRLQAEHDCYVRSN